ncbi:MAG: hypothetical protein R3B84_10635 [Zavarzinella sp.]
MMTRKFLPFVFLSPAILLITSAQAEDISDKLLVKRIGEAIVEGHSPDKVEVKVGVYARINTNSEADASKFSLLVGLIMVDGYGPFDSPLVAAKTVVYWNNQTSNHRKDIIVGIYWTEHTTVFFSGYLVIP